MSTIEFQHKITLIWIIFKIFEKKFRVEKTWKNLPNSGFLYTLYIPCLNYLFQERDAMFKDLCEWINAKEFAPPKVVERSLEQYEEALKMAMESSDAKQLFVMW